MYLIELNEKDWFFNEDGILSILKKKHEEDGWCMFRCTDYGSTEVNGKLYRVFPLTERNKYISDEILFWRKSLRDRKLLNVEIARELSKFSISLMEIQDEVDLDNNSPQIWKHIEPYKSILEKLSTYCIEQLKRTA